MLCRADATEGEEMKDLTVAQKLLVIDGLIDDISMRLDLINKLKGTDGKLPPHLIPLGRKYAERIVRMQELRDTFILELPKTLKIKSVEKHDESGMLAVTLQEYGYKLK